jgi:hypothetical protein
VTEIVQEQVFEDDGAEDPPMAPAKPAAKTAPAKPAAQKGSQGNLLSFFKKK